jgi:two-component system sensor histidine kinase DesK
MPSIFGEFDTALDNLLTQWQNQLGFRPAYRFDGPVESLPPKVIDNMTQTITLALSNIERHAHATKTLIEITVAEDASRLMIADNGVGAGSDPQGRGVRRIRALAAALGGRVEFLETSGGGTQIDWTVPVST